MTNDLRPCPFCGGEAHASLAAYASGATAHALCDGCGAVVLGYGRGERGLRDAVKRWNRRAGSTCRPLVADDGAGAWGVYCSECGYRFAGPHGKREVPEHMATRRDIMPCYCPYCGAKVVSK